MARTFRSKSAHLGQSPVIQHEMDVGVADASSVELDEDFIRFWAIR